MFISTYCTTVTLTLLRIKRKTMKHCWFTCDGEGERVSMGSASVNRMLRALFYIVVVFGFGKQRG